MKLFRIKVQADKYPTEFNVEASNVATATARAMREWQKKFKGSRASEWSIKVIKSNGVIRTTVKENTD